MRNKRRISFLYCLLFLSVPMAINAFPVPLIQNYDYRMALEDSSSGTIYVSMDSGILAKEDSLIARLQQFLKERKRDIWGDKFSKVALFSDSMYAHPREAMLRRDRKAWADHFLAEFDSKRNVVWLFPAIPIKKKKIPLPPSPN